MKTRWLLRRTLILVPLIWPALTAGFVGQSAESRQGPEITVKTRTDLVQIAVLVRRSGAHVAGLAKSNFVVQQDGKDRPIATFDEVKVSGRASGKGPGQEFGNTGDAAVGSQQVMVIAIDTVNTPVMDQAYFKEELIKFLTEADDTEVLLGLVQLTRSGVRVLHDLTTDPKTLLAVVRKNNPVQPTTNADRNPQLAVLADESAQAVDLGADNAQRLFDNANFLQQNENRMVQFQSRAARIDTLASLQQLAQALKAWPGRKTLLWAGSGYELLGGFQEVKEITRVARSQVNFSESLDQHAYTWHLLSDANVAVYPIDTRRTVNTAYEVMSPSHHYSPLNSEREMARQKDSEIIDTFEQIAGQTGGKPCIYRTDLRNCLREAAEDSAAYYLLGFYVDKTRNQPGWHTVNVKLDQKASLRYRPGFEIAPVNAETVRNMDLHLALNSPFSFPALRFQGRFSGFKETGGKKSVGFELMIPPASVTIEEDSGRVNFDIVVVARTVGGAEAARLGQRIDRKLVPANIADIKASGIHYTNKIDLPPGKYGVWFVIRDNAGGSTGSVVTALNVP